MSDVTINMLGRSGGKSVLAVFRGLRYEPHPSRLAYFASYDETTYFTERDWRRLKRLMRRPNATRSTRRTDFGRRLP